MFSLSRFAHGWVFIPSHSRPSRDSASCHTGLTLLGVSFGGYVVLSYAARGDPRVGAVAVQGTFARYPLSLTNRLLLGLSHLLPTTFGAWAFRRRILEGAENAHLRRSAPGLDVLHADWCAKTPFATLRRRTRIIDREDQSAAVGKITPVRELVVGQGEINATNATNARDQALAEQKLPRQQQSFTVHGRVWGVANAALTELPKWEVRAGKVVRVQDLVPPSVSSPAFDDLRTFFILGTEFDAVTDTLKVQPDRPAARVTSLLARRTPVESRR